MTVREGDRVLFPAAVGQAIAGEKDLLVMNEDDILAVIED
jgi:co-chaperonin GroES (HSP10)